MYDNITRIKTSMWKKSINLKYTKNSNDLFIQPIIQSRD